MRQLYVLSPQFLYKYAPHAPPLCLDILPQQLQTTPVRYLQDTQTPWPIKRHLPPQLPWQNRLYAPPRNAPVRSSPQTLPHPSHSSTPQIPPSQSPHPQPHPSISHARPTSQQRYETNMSTYESFPRHWQQRWRVQHPRQQSGEKRLRIRTLKNTLQTLR
jgi:hypothetical protein